MGTALPEERAGLLFDLGEASSGISVAEPQADELVCLCNSVSKGDIAACVAAGAETLADVAARTRATTGCGSCKADVLQLVAWATPSAIAA
jgi:nitrite reductase (NADH) large subunit